MQAHELVIAVTLTYITPRIIVTHYIFLHCSIQVYASPDFRAPKLRPRHDSAIALAISYPGDRAELHENFFLQIFINVTPDIYDTFAYRESSKDREKTDRTPVKPDSSS